MEEVHFTLEQPSYSMTAMLISNFILTTIVFSTVVFVLSSIPSLADSVVLNRCEASAIAILTIEYLLRLLCHRGLRLQFILNPFNMIDLMAVLPWYLELLDAEHLSALRILRILRLLRLLKHSEGLQMFLSCMARSLGQSALDGRTLSHAPRRHRGNVEYDRGHGCLCARREHG